MSSFNRVDGFDEEMHLNHHQQLDPSTKKNTRTDYTVLVVMGSSRLNVGDALGVTQYTSDEGGDL